MPFTQESFLGQIRHGDFRNWRERLSRLPELEASFFEAGDSVVVGSAGDLTAAQTESLREQLLQFKPWRKGPFTLFGINIDSEWRSDMKWSRLQDHITPLAGRKVLDVGCGNGYYGFRMTGCGAALVVGIDQHIPYVAQSWAVKRFLPELPVFVLPLSSAMLPDNLEAFDTVFSMGVLYHAKSPIDHLLQLKSALRPGGELVLETLFVEGGEGHCLTPRGRYARMANLWFIPSIASLQRWLSRCGFDNIRVVNTSTTTSDEQRSTVWMPFDSLNEALDPTDPSKTIEGLPSPQRVVVVARRS